jgi:hypothetical protein
MEAYVFALLVDGRQTYVEEVLAQRVWITISTQRAFRGKWAAKSELNPGAGLLQPGCLLDEA